MTEQRDFDSAGVRIAYLDKAGRALSGAAPVDARTDGKALPILLIHGFASNIAMNWVSTRWVQALSATGRRIVAIDNRGHGDSQKLYGLTDYGAPLMAEDARRLLDHLNIERAHVIGYSMGARIAAFLAVAHGARVRSIVFGGLGINMVRGMAGTGPIAHALEAASIDEVKNPTARTFRAFAEQTKSDLRALAACIRSSRTPITAEMLRDIKCPVLVAVGEHDVIGGSPAALADLLPNARAYTIAGREHMKAVGDANFQAEVLAFLDAVESNTFTNDNGPNGHGPGEGAGP